MSDTAEATAWFSDNESVSSSNSTHNAAASSRRRRLVTDPEVWADYYSEELAILWHNLQDQCSAMGWAVLDKGTFPDFVTFCLNHSSKVPPSV